MPSGVDDLLMFDTPPIAVPKRVAGEVSGSPEPWNRINQALDEGRLVERNFMRTDDEPTTGVPSIDLLRVGTARGDLDRVTAQLRSVLQPAAQADARRMVVREGQYDVWSR